MANHYYIISEVQFFRDKDDGNTRYFVSGTGINLNDPCSSKMPTVEEITKALTEFGLETRKLLHNEDRLEISAIKNENAGLWLIFTDINTQNKEVNMFETGRGSDDVLNIEFVKYLGKTCGNFLFYSDAGSMSFITPNRANEVILNEMYG